MNFDWQGMLSQNAPGIGSMIGQGLGGLFGNYQNPAQAAMPYLEQIPGMAQKNFGPYIQAGQRQLPGLQREYGSLISNPGARINQIGQSYEQSPGLQFAIQKALEAAGHGAAAGGMAGSPQHEYQNMQQAQGLASQDFNQWLTHALGQYDTGLAGGQNIYQGGLQAAGGLNKSMQDALEAQATAQAQAAEAKNKHGGGLFGALGDIAGAALPFLSFL